jgi:hypothetical protein
MRTVSGFNQLNDYYKDRLQAERQAYSEAEQQAQAEGTTGDAIWLRWQEEARSQERAAAGLSPLVGLNHTQQQNAAGRLPAIAAAAKQQRERIARSTPFGVWVRAFEQQFGRVPTDAESRAAGMLP